MRYSAICLVFVFLYSYSLQAQESSNLEVFTISGVGFGLPASDASQVLGPKISTKLGLEISRSKKSLLFSPVVHLLVFSYDQQEKDAESENMIQNGRSSQSTLILNLGYRKNIKALTAYATAGPGVGLLKEPRSIVMPQEEQVRISTVNVWSAALSGGLGVECRFKQFAFFAEGSALYHFKKIQNRSNLVFPVYFGLKSDISGVLK